MAIRLVLLLLFCVPLYGEPGPILFLICKGQHQEALKLYRNRAEIEGKHDFDLLQEIALSILAQGIEDEDAEVVVRSLYGSAVALNDKTERFFERAWSKPNPVIQLAALNFIAKTRSDTSLMCINQGMGSNQPLIRLEACLLMAERRAPNACHKIEAVMQKLPEEVWFLFPQIFAQIGDRDSLRLMRKFLAHADPKVRTEALLAIASTNRDDLLREVRRSLSHGDPQTKEAAAYTLGALKDEMSVNELSCLTTSCYPSVKLAALDALVKIGRKEYLPGLIQMAEEGDLFAICALRDASGSEEALARLLDNPDRNIRVNACLSLLSMKDCRCLQVLPEFLLKDARDLCYIPASTPALAFTAYKAIPSARQNMKELPQAFEISLKAREEALRLALELPENQFFAIANAIFRTEQNDLIPMTIELLINKNRPEVIEFLKNEEQHVGSPFIRSFSCLALFKLREKGGYEEKLKRWLVQEASLDIIKFRPFIPWELKKEVSPYELHPNDKASLFISALEAFVVFDEDKGIDLMLEMLEKGCDKNRYVIAGLLLRASQ